MGRAFHRLLPEAGIITRNDSLHDILTSPSTPPHVPILVCTTSDALPSVITATPPHCHPDLILIQNGMFTTHPYTQCTRVLLYLAAVETGTEPPSIINTYHTFTDGQKTVCFGGGRHAQWFCHMLTQHGFACRCIDDADEFEQLEMHKLLWASAMWVMSQALGGVGVGQVVTLHRPALEDLITDLCSSCCCCKVDVERAMQEVVEYSLSIPLAVPSRAMALKEFEWRNGWFLEQRWCGEQTGRRGGSSGDGDACGGVHRAWLRRAGVDLRLLNDQ